TTVRYSDTNGASVEWDLPVSGLNTQEWAAIETLFQAAQGRLGTFTFLDPTGNLLLNSEDFSQGSWVKDPLLQFTAAVTDPLGTMRATMAINAGQTSQRLTQTISAPGGYQYCFSVYARASAGSATLVRATPSKSVSQTFPVTTAWQRLIASGNLGAAEPQVSFAIELPAGASVQLFGAQAEPQLGASPYKMTTTQSGVYPSARFQDDRLLATARGTDQNEGTIRIFSKSGE
ncbi:MAG: phage head spike fiber domain-containing protein, partial [Bryobacteraceae bacterium]